MENSTGGKFSIARKSIDGKSIDRNITGTIYINKKVLTENYLLLLKLELTLGFKLCRRFVVDSPKYIFR